MSRRLANFIGGILILTSLVFFPHPAAIFAGERQISGPQVLEIHPDHVVILEAPEGAGFRVLLSFAELERLVGKTVYTARLVLPGIQVTDALTLEVYPVARAWDRETVSWSYPWSEPGGDFDALQYCRAPLVPERDPSIPLSFNVTRSIWKVVNDREPGFGFLVMPARHVIEEEGEQSRLGVPVEYADAFAAQDDVKLILFCGGS